MSDCERRNFFRAGALAFLIAGAAACGSEAATDPNSSEISWSYGPTNGGATAVHTKGAGKDGPPIAVGWKFRLLDGKRLTVQPHELAKTHALFGKVEMNIGLFDKTGKQIGTVRSGLVEAQGAGFSFDLEEDVASRLWDVVIWFCKP